MKFQIKCRFTFKVLFECDADSIKAALEEAVEAKANLSDANLRRADLRRADLRDANLSGANLSDAKKDFLDVISRLPMEIPGLYKAILDGRIDGSQYSGECACLKGTLANVKHCSVDGLREFGIVANSLAPSEVLFMAIQKGDTPENNPISAIVKGWIEEFCKEKGISIPTRKVVLE